MTHKRNMGYPTAATVAFTLLGAHALAQEKAVVPADLQAAIMARALSYDRALKARAGRAVVIGVLAKSGDSASLAAQERMLQALGAVEPRTVHGLPLQAVGAAFQDRTTLLAWIDKEGIDALYLAPGLTGELAAIQSVCQERKLASLSSSRSFVEKGIAVAVVAKGASAGLLVNLSAATASGMDLDPKLLQLSEVRR